MPARTAASMTLYVLVVLIRKTSASGTSWTRGIAAKWMSTSMGCGRKEGCSSSMPLYTPIAPKAWPESVRSAISVRQRGSEAGFRSTLRTSWPASSSSFKIQAPILPLPPVTTIRFIRPSSTFLSLASAAGLTECLRRGVLVHERAREVDAPHENRIACVLRVVDEPRQRVRPAWVAAEPRVQPDRHHPADAVVVVAQAVQLCLRILVKVFRAAVPLRDHEPRVVDDQGVGRHEVRLSIHSRPIGEVVVVAIEVIDEAAFLDDQLAGVDAHLAAVPAQRPGADRFLDRGHCALDRLALLATRHLEVLHPAVSVARDLVASLG